MLGRILCLAAAAAASCAAAAPNAAAAPLPLLTLDTDAGSDFDDTWALIFLLSRSQPTDPLRSFDFALVQCSTFNTTNRARIVAKILYDLGRFDVAVGVGAYTGEDAMPQLPAAAGFELSDFVAAGGTVYNGTDHLAALLAAATPSAPLFAVEIAPATSLGGVVRASPALAANTVLSAMSGSIHHGYGNSSQPEVEYKCVPRLGRSAPLPPSALARSLSHAHTHAPLLSPLRLAACALTFPPARPCTARRGWRRCS